MNISWRMLMMCFGFGISAIFAAGGLTIPPDQPICKVYDVIKLAATIGGILAIAWAYVNLQSTEDPLERRKAKAIGAGAVVGIIIVWLAPIIITYITSASNICGWS